MPFAFLLRTEQFTALKEIYMKAGHVFVLVFSLTHLASVNELGELREQILRLKGRKVSTGGRVTWGSLPALPSISSATSEDPYALSLSRTLPFRPPSS